MAKIQDILSSIASKNRQMKEFRSAHDKECQELANRIKQLQKEVSDASFKCRVSKSNDISLLSRAFSAPISEWAEFLIPILNQHTNSNWSLVAEWYGHTIEPGLIEKYLLKQQAYDVVDGYVVKLSSDDEKNSSIIFDSIMSRRYAISERVRDNENPDSVFLKDGSVDVDKLESYSFLSQTESFGFENAETALKLNYEDEYPFLREPIMKRAENYLEQKVYVSSDDFLADSEMEN